MQLGTLTQLLQLQLASQLLQLQLVGGYFEAATTLAPTRLRSERYGRFEYLPVPMPPAFALVNKTDLELMNSIRLHVTCGVSWRLRNLSTATLLSRRVLLSASSFLSPYFETPKELRVWCWGASGDARLPFRYRVWRLVRLVPRSANPEHQFTRLGRYTMLHDVAVIHTQDPIHLSPKFPTQRNLAYPAALPESAATEIPGGRCRIHGVGFETEDELRLNFGIVWHFLNKSQQVDCDRFLPQFWGPYLCFRNDDVLYGLPSGAGLHCGQNLKNKIFGVGAYEIRYNKRRILVFTDVRPYLDLIKQLMRLEDHEYYEYAMAEYAPKKVPLKVLYPGIDA